MPNWCENRFVVSGTKSNLLLFQTKVKGTHATYALNETEKKLYERMGEAAKDETVYNFMFHSLVPVPAEVLAAGFSDAGYHWQANHWGTKWDVAGATLIEEEGTLVYTFDTAWAPPEPWVKHVSAQFPHLVFELAYFEPGMCFAGHVSYENGEMIEEEHVSDDVEAIKHVMVGKLGYTQDEVDDYWQYDEEDEEDEEDDEEDDEEEYS